MRIILQVGLAMAVSALISCFDTSKNSFEQRPLDAQIIDRYTQFIKLSSFTESNKTLEVRYWSAFWKDSFPVRLQRFFIDSQNYYYESYIFYKTGFFPITSKLDFVSDSLTSTHFIVKLPYQVVDTIIRQFPDSILLDINKSIFNRKVNEKAKISDVPMCLLQIKNKNRYYSAFLKNPRFLVIDSIPEYNPYLQLINDFVFFSTNSLTINQQDSLIFITTRLSKNAYEHP